MASIIVTVQHFMEKKHSTKWTENQVIKIIKSICTEKGNYLNSKVKRQAKRKHGVRKKTKVQDKSANVNSDVSEDEDFEPQESSAPEDRRESLKRKYVEKLKFKLHRDRQLGVLPEISSLSILG